MTITRICLALALLLIPFKGGDAGVVSLALFAVLAAGGWSAWALARPRPTLRGMPLHWPLLAIILVTLLTTGTSVYYPASIHTLWQTLIITALAVLACVVPLERRHLALGAALFAGAVLAGEINGFSGWITWYQAHGLTNWRVQSTWENANLYAAFLLVILPLLAVLTRQAAALSASRALLLRVLFGLATALGVAALVLTQSRGGLLAFLLAMLVFIPLWLWAEGKLTGKGLGLFAVGLVLFVGLALLSPLGQRLLDPALRAKQLHSQVFRYYTWLGDWEMIKDYPLFGSGPGTFPSIFGQYQIAGYTRHGHHLYLQAWAETGLVGLAALCWLFGAIAALGLRALRCRDGEHALLTRTLAAGLLGGLLALLLHGLLDSDWTYTGIQLALLLQAALVWRLAEADTRPERPAPALLRWPVAGLLCLVALCQLWGAKAAQALEQGRDLIAAAQTADTPRAQMTLLGEARRAFADAVGLAPTNASYLRAASIYAPPPLAEEYLQRAQSIERTNAVNWLFMGDLLLRQQRYHEAQAAYRRAETLQPMTLPALYGTAKASWLTHDPTVARLVIGRLLATDQTPMARFHPIEVPEPWYVRGWYASGMLALQSGQHRGALTAFKRTIDAATAYEHGFTKEAEAWATYSHNERERALMQTLASEAYRHLRQLDRTSAQGYADQVEMSFRLPAKDRTTPFPE